MLVQVLVQGDVGHGKRVAQPKGIATQTTRAVSMAVATAITMRIAAAVATQVMLLQ